MKKWQPSFITLFFSLGFAIILFAIASLVSYSIQQSNAIRYKTSMAAILQAKRFELLMTMRKQATRRAILLNRMYTEDDHFIINELFDRFHHTSAVSVTALLEFAKLPLTREEQDILGHLRQAMIQTGASQNKVLDLIVEEKTEQAKKLLKSKTLGYQERNLSYMDQLQASIEQWYRHTIDDISIEHQKIIKMIFYAGIFLFAFSIFIILFVIRYILKKETKLIKRAQVTLDAINQSIITTDPEGVVDYLNPHAQQLCSNLHLSLQGKRLQKNFPLYYQNKPVILHEQICQVIQSKQALHQKHTCSLGNDTGKLWIHYDIAPILDDHGNKILGTNLIIHDVTTIHNLNQKLKWQANHDALTGLYNRRYLDDIIRRSVHHAQNKPYQSILCYIDLDNFKAINDQAGHQAGDRVLIDIAAILQDQVREYDVVARIGGDEFIILFYRCNLHQGQEIANKILNRIFDYRLHWQGQQYQLGASIGLTMIDHNTESVEQIIARTDQALYQAKKSGKGRIVISE